MTTTTRRRRGAQPGSRNAVKPPGTHHTRHNITLPPGVADYLRRLGDGQITRGITLLVEEHQQNQENAR